MKEGIAVILQCIGYAVAASLCLFVPVYLFFWLTQTVSFAKSYSLGVTLVIALAYAYYRICTNLENTKPSFTLYKKLLNSRVIAGIFVGCAIAAVVAYTVYDVQRSQQIWEERLARLSSKKALPTSCYDIGVQYGRASANGLKGEVVDEKNDVVIPERCRNQPETNRGIVKGLKISGTL
ncbi:hypothetical protein [Pseudomonas lactis]|uniref:hypothetical protein n=1 Tax=Pseudomonas lactis TaxID=1615674 RepID=UPI001909F381|nr:hypothetical protein [Pseudomonas lactis]MBK3444588.1 hypothetical protein [Pseudomonas lactis]